MKRPRLSREAFAGLACACALFAAGCRPDNDVAPGAPVLMELIIVQATPGFPTATTILPDTADCAGSVVAGGVCAPATDVFCRLATSNDWCSCAGNDPKMPDVGAWSCPPFGVVSAVIAVFDRLLDTVPLTPLPPAPGMDPDPGRTDFPLFGQFLFGSFRANGPSLFSAPQPAFPSGATVTVTLDGTKVRAKDGATAFTGTGLLQDGVLRFNTAPLSVSFADPDPATDPVAVTATFSNFVDPVAVDMTTTATATGTDIRVEGDGDGVTLTIVPSAPATAWPAGATVVITMTAATPDAAGGTLGTPATHMFTAP
jgi:hypothetical protein